MSQFKGKSGRILILDDEGKVLFECKCSKFEVSFETFQFEAEGYQKTFHKIDENGHSILNLQARVPADEDGMVAKGYA